MVRGPGDFRALRRLAASNAGVKVGDLRSDTGASVNERRGRLSYLPMKVKVKMIRHVVRMPSPQRSTVGLPGTEHSSAIHPCVRKVGTVDDPAKRVLESRFP
jgi:hypothetical protein